MSRRLVAAVVAAAAFALVLVLHTPRSLPDLAIRGLLASAVAAPPLLGLRWPVWAWCAVVVALPASALVFRWTDYASLGWLPGIAMTGVFALYLVAEQRPWPTLAGVYVVSVAVTTSVWLSFVMVGSARIADPDNLFQIFLVPAIAMAVGYAAQIRQRATRERTQSQAEAAVLEERARIARELHDVVAHHMSVLALRADSARYRFPNLPDELREEFAALHSTAHGGMTEMRRLLGVLRTEQDGTDLAPQPDARQIAELVSRVREAGSEVTLRLDGDYGNLPAGLALSAYRIVQEALSNATKHAPGHAVDVEMTVTDDVVRLSVRNATSGPASVDGRPGHGLIGMRERVAMLGGSLDAGPTADGFEVRASLPRGGG